MAYKGKFKPLNPKKYLGDTKNIVYRSSWELIYLSKLDKDDNVVKWSSEEIQVPYRSPIDGQIHRYFVDMYVEYKNGDKFLIEIKPEKQTRPPEKQSKPTKKYLKEVVTWGINEAKFLAATKYAEKRGWKFKILTEKHLGIK